MGASRRPAESHAHVWSTVGKCAGAGDASRSGYLGHAINGRTDRVAGADWISADAEV